MHISLLQALSPTYRPKVLMIKTMCTCLLSPTKADSPFFILLTN